MSKNKKLPLFVLNETIVVKEFIDSWKSDLSEELTWFRKNLLKQTEADLEIPVNFVKSLERNLNLGNLCKKLEEKIDPKINLKLLSSDIRKYHHELIDKTVEVGSKRHMDDCDHSSPLAVLTVQIFKPIKKDKNHRIKINLDREIQVLSCQPLSVLRDSYFCLIDLIDQPDYSDNPTFTLPSLNQHEKAGIFLIDNTIYYDERNKTSTIDVILKWIKTNVDDSCSKKPMGESRFQDLRIQLGYPYLYLHRSNCEHLLVFTDIRLFIPKIEDSVYKYPKSTLQGKMNTIKCQMCSMNFAKWITLHNQRLPMSPYYFCHNCFLTFNYDSKFQKIGSFRAFPLIFNINDYL